MTTVLLSGFEPFDAAETNSSWDAVQLVQRDWRGAASITTVLLPVEFGTAWQRLDEAIFEHSPDIVIAVGLADGRTAITPERVAVNLEDARIPDNAAAQPRETPVVAGGPAAYFSALPVSAIAEAIRTAGISSEVSLSAGAYVCNDLMYRLMHSGAGRSAEVMSGFIHVPSAASMPVTTIAQALAIAVEQSLEGRDAGLQSLANHGG